MVEFSPKLQSASVVSAELLTPPLSDECQPHLIFFLFLAENESIFIDNSLNM